MSSADFDDTRDFPPSGGGHGSTNLASSLSMSEADESEYLATAAVGYDHPSPPMVTSARMRNDKLRFKSLFKRGTNPSSSGAIPKQPQVTYHFKGSIACGECRLRDSPSDFLRRVTQPGKSVLSSDELLQLVETQPATLILYYCQDKLIC